MGGFFNIREPTDTNRMHEHPIVMEIFPRHEWIGFFEKLNRYDDNITQEFSMALTC